MPDAMTTCHIRPESDTTPEPAAQAIEGDHANRHRDTR
jgi:hypothetical protein